MNFTGQGLRAQTMHAANREKTCIDCKGIARRLPHIPPGEAPMDTPGQVVPSPGGAATPAAGTAPAASAERP